MALYVRKLAKRTNMTLFQSVSDVSEINADTILAEFRTRDNTLSFWEVENSSDMINGILAIALTSSTIETMDFIIFDEKYMQKYGLEMAPSNPGAIPLYEYQDAHRDAFGLTLGKFGNLALLYKELAGLDEPACFLVRKTKKELENHIKDAIIRDKVNLQYANEKIKDKLIAISDELNAS